MQKSLELIWNSPKCLGDVPSKRSGHSFTIIGDYGYLFGGSDFRKPAGPNNEFYKVDMTTGDFYWTKKQFPEGQCPEPRSHHSAVAFENKIIVFGGFKNSNARYNDTWVYDTVTDEWLQPVSTSAEVMNEVSESETGKEVVIEIPTPRGSHSAVLIQGNKMLIFGGYGGSGYTRKDFNDVMALDLATWQWETVPCAGEVPDARSGHQGVVVKDQLFIMGGWNSITQFADLYVLDIKSWVWSKPSVGGDFGPPRWNFAAVSVCAVPHWKVFVFGGNSGDLNDAAVKPQGEYRNDLCVLDTGSMQWSRPDIAGVPPSQRGETMMTYDAKQGRLAMFGGWANRWYGDVFTCKVSEIVGPPYAVFGISSVLGPITGATQCTLTGTGFKSGGSQVLVRLACLKGLLDVSGEIVDDNTIVFETPNYEKHGVNAVECRVAIGGKALSNSFVPFDYFAVTSADHTLAFGPGLVNNCLAGFPASIIIQARDGTGSNRVTGLDQFTFKCSKITRTKDDKEVLEEIDTDSFPMKCVDNNNGTYALSVTYPDEGQYALTIAFAGTFQGKAGPIRGSPFRVSVAIGSDASMNSFDSPLLSDHIRQQIKDAKEYATSTLKSLKKAVPKAEVDALIKVKDALADLDAKKSTVDLTLDTCYASLQHFKGQGKSMDRLLEQLEGAAAQWKDTVKQAPAVQQSIAPLVKTWSSIMEEQIEEYCKSMQAKSKVFKTRAFYDDKVSVIEAIASIAEGEKFLHGELEELQKKTLLVTTFEFPHLIKGAKDCADDLNTELAEMKVLWQTAQQLEEFLSNANRCLWRDMKIDELEDDAKGQVKSVKSLNKCVRWTNAFKRIDKQSKDFLNTIPLISLLCAKSMRDRHWIALKKVTQKDFQPPYADPELLLGSILELRLHEFSNDVEEICDQAIKELKIENTLTQIAQRWSSVMWLMDPYKGTEVTLLKLSEEDFESLEGDQLTVQGMLASRFVKQFELEAQSVSKTYSIICLLTMPYNNS